MKNSTWELIHLGSRVTAAVVLTWGGLPWPGVFFAFAAGMALTGFLWARAIEAGEGE